jgi:hypothetical protein
MLLKPAMVFKLIALLVPIVFLEPASAFRIKRLETNSGTVLRLLGDVREGDYGRLKSVLQNESVVGLEIRSDGGSLEEGVDIAGVVRDKSLIVYASGECDSACALIFFAAKERYMDRGSKIGVHSVSNDRGKEDADSTRVTVRMSRLLVGFGVPHSVIGKMVATPPARITFLDNRDLVGLNVHRANPFRRNDSAASMSQDGKTSAACDAAVDVEPEAIASVRQKSGRTSTAHASRDP